jgi:WhiB family redox-sensing transcriptional regulator
MATPAPDSRDWRHRAACRGENPDDFFPVGSDDSAATAAQTKRATRVCAGCPVRTDCLDFAIATRQPHGIWGGTTETERTREHRRVLRNRRAAA